MKDQTKNINYQIEVLNIELSGIIAITRRPNLQFREMYENRIAVLLAKKNNLIKSLGA